MKSQLILSLFAVGVNAVAVDVTPTTKVMTLLRGMLEHGKQAKNAEQVVFHHKEQFCKDHSAETTSAISDEDLTIGTITAEINNFRSGVTLYDRNIAVAGQDENTWSADMIAADSVRTVEGADYAMTHKDYTEGIEAIGRAVAVLKAQTHDRSQAASLTQVTAQAAALAQVTSLQDLNLIPDTAKRAIDAFVQTGDLNADIGDDINAPEANAYEFQAHGVIDMLEKLQGKFMDEKAQLEKEEQAAYHAFQLLKAGLTDQIHQAQEDITGDWTRKGKVNQAKAQKISDRSDEVRLQAVDEKFLKDLTTDCRMTRSDFDARQQLRAEEITAIEKALTILTDEVAGYATKHLPALLQKKASLAQLRFTVISQIQGRLVKFLRERAQEIGSSVLEAVAERASADPFTKVKKMIKDLVVRLMEEANEEADHKGWCDTELATNKQTRGEKTGAVETLQADVDQLVAAIAKISTEVTDLHKAVSVIQSSMADATKIRSDEAKANAATVSDAQDAQTALAQALTVVKEFYSKAMEATSLAQTSRPYNGMTEESVGVIGMLEVIESDFARLESETKASEATAQKEFDTFMTDSKVASAEKDTVIEHKTAKSTDATQSLASKKGDLEGTQKELDAALTYYNKLKPSCVDSGNTYEDRVARRKQEVESLQEALQVMNGEDIATV